LHTGELIYNTGNDEKLYTDGEVATITFFRREGKYWFAATCWGGKVSFFSAPTVDKGRCFLTIKHVKSNYHHGDVVCGDTTFKNNFATGSIENVICFWQTYSAVENKVILIPNDLANKINRYVRHLKFLDPQSNEYLLEYKMDRTNEIPSVT